MKDITGRDDYVIAKALTYAIAFIGSLPPKNQEQSDRDDMVTLLRARTSDDIRTILADTVHSKTGIRPALTDRKREA